MKRLILALVGSIALIGFGFYIRGPKPLASSPAETLGEQTASETVRKPEFEKAEGWASKPRYQVPVEGRRLSPAPSASSAETEARFSFNQAIETLVSTQATYEQKQAAWKQLKTSGNLDQAISELEQLRADNLQMAEYPAALGQAYLKKCADTQDVRKQAILAMKADQMFDEALDLDSSNWEARFTKAVGMSYWPTNLNKGQETIEHFQTLIEQQEAQPSQPQFAQSYKWLGDQYQKAGQTDYAQQVWQRGAQLFPDNEELRKKLASAQ